MQIRIAYPSHVVYKSGFPALNLSIFFRISGFCKWSSNVLDTIIFLQFISPRLIEDNYAIAKGEKNFFFKYLCPAPLGSDLHRTPAIELFTCIVLF